MHSLIILGDIILDVPFPGAKLEKWLPVERPLSSCIAATMGARLDRQANFCEEPQRVAQTRLRRVTVGDCPGKLRVERVAAQSVDNERSQQGKVRKSYSLQELQRQGTRSLYVITSERAERFPSGRSG
jgi:hypothetical protein